MELTSPRRQRIAAATGPLILLREARWAAARTRTGEAAATIGIGRRPATVRRSSEATAVLRTRVVATGGAHLRVRSSICASRLYAPRRTGAAARGPATEVVADTVRRLPATVVRMAHPVTAAVAPRRMAAVVVITAAEVGDTTPVEVVADITAEAAVGTPAEVAVTRAVAAATPEAVIAKSS